MPWVDSELGDQCDEAYLATLSLHILGLLIPLIFFFHLHLLFHLSYCTQKGEKEYG